MKRTKLTPNPLAQSLTGAILSDLDSGPTPTCVVRRHAGGRAESEATKETVPATRAALAEYFTRQMWPLPIKAEALSFIRADAFYSMVLHDGMPLGFVSRIPIDSEQPAPQ